MKTTSFTAAFFAIAGTAIAAPASSQSELKDLQLTKFTASLYDQALPAYRIVNFKLSDPNSNVDTNCNTAWYVVVKPHINLS